MEDIILSQYSSCYWLVLPRPLQLGPRIISLTPLKFPPLVSVTVSHHALASVTVSLTRCEFYLEYHMVCHVLRVRGLDTPETNANILLLVLAT